jgi:hypothetical protein
LDVGGAAGSTGASAGIGGSTTGSGGTAFGGNAGRSVGGAAGVGAAGVGGASGTGSGCGLAALDCSVSSGDNPCIACAKRECCSELICCATDNVCSDTTGAGELTCIQQCAFATMADGGVVNTTTISACASECASHGVIAPTTNDILACLLNGVHSNGRTGNDCFIECFAGEFSEK